VSVSLAAAAAERVPIADSVAAAVPAKVRAKLPVSVQDLPCAGLAQVFPVIVNADGRGPGVTLSKPRGELPVLVNMDVCDTVRPTVPPVIMAEALNAIFGPCLAALPLDVVSGVVGIVRSLLAAYAWATACARAPVVTRNTPCRAEREGDLGPLFSALHAIHIRRSKCLA
jgi:hypothetical protein